MVHSKEPYSTRRDLAGGGPNVRSRVRFGPALTFTWKVNYNIYIYIYIIILCSFNIQWIYIISITLLRKISIIHGIFINIFVISNTFHWNPSLRDITILKLLLLYGIYTLQIYYLYININNLI
jgi:hypothetical protein